MTTYELLFPGHRLIGRLLTQPPALVFAILSVPGLVLLGLAACCQMLSIPGAGQDFGYLVTLNWSVMMTVGLPAIFSLAAYLDRSVLACIERLASEDWKVIRTADGLLATGYADHLQRKLSARDLPLFWGCVVITTLAIGYDVAHILLTFLSAVRHQPVHINPITDRWALGFGLAEATSKPTLLANFVFDFVAYSCEAVYVFLGFYWVGKFWQLLFYIARLARPNEPEFRLDFRVDDPVDRLGLYPLGKLFNGFLVVIIIFFAYICLYRVQLSAFTNEWQVSTYCVHVITWAIGGIKAVSWQMQPFLTKTSVTPGVVMLLIFMWIPVITIVYVPVVVLRQRLLVMRDEKLDSLMNTRQHSQNQAERDEAQTQMNKLNKAEVWPCGNIAAWRFFVLTGLLVVAIIWPPATFIMPLVFLLYVVAPLLKRLALPKPGSP